MGNLAMMQIEEEVKRFLADGKPEVLCIKGKWGVGKTYAWKKFLKDTRKSHALQAPNYSYVSLFGINALRDLRYAIAENTITSESLDDESTELTMKQASKLAVDRLRGAAPLLDAAINFIGGKNAQESIHRLAFLMVRNQLVCLDDLERAGKGLTQRDILGLASSLKEDRGCQVVLLLNDKEMKKRHRKEFDRQLEKVVDVTLTFSPSPEEATAIALPEESDASIFLKDRITSLRITNIRTIKKIERLSTRLVEIVRDYGDVVEKEAVSAAALGAWSLLQPNEAPDLDYLCDYNALLMATLTEKEAPSRRVQEWNGLLSDYGFTMATSMDRAIFDGVKAGYFNKDRVKLAAEERKLYIERSSGQNSFSEAWRLYNNRLDIDDKELLDALVAGAKDNLSILGVADINVTIKFLRQFGRGADGDEIAELYTDAQVATPEFFDEGNHDFALAGELDDALRRAIERARQSLVDNRDPKEVLSEAAKQGTWRSRDVKLLSSVAPEKFAGWFETLRGTELRKSIETALAMSKSDDENAEKLRKSLGKGLQIIANKSPIRANRLLRFGFPLD